MEENTSDQKNNNVDTANPPVARKSNGWRWVVGIIATIVLSLALLSYAGYAISSQEVVKPALAKTLDIVIKESGIESITPAINYLNAINKDKADLSSLQSLSSMDQTQIQKDLAGMSPEQSQKYLEDKFATPLYESTKMISDMQKVDPNANIETSQLSFISEANVSNHAAIQKNLMILAGFFLVLLVILIIISSGTGRISNPGIVILLGSLPGLLLFGFSNQLIDRFGPSFLQKYTGQPMYNDILKQVILPLTIIVRNIYLEAALVGAGLIGLALIIHIIIAVASSKKTVPIQK